MGNLSTPKSVQKLQTALHARAKAEAGYRFYALYDKIRREDIVHKESVRNTGGPKAWSGLINRTPARDRPGALGWWRGSQYR